MKIYQLRIFFLLLLLISSFLSHAQQTPNPDEGMDLFLLVIAGIGIAAMLGGAIVTAFFATIILLVITALVSFGILSVSILAGLYTCSISAIFKTFFVLAFALCNSVFALGICLIGQQIFQWQIETSTLYTITITGGFISGVLIALATYYLFQKALQYFIARPKSI